MSDTTRCQRTNTCGNGKQVASPTKGTPTNPQISSFPQTLRDSSSPEELQGGNDHFLRSGGEMQDPMTDLWQTSSTLHGPNTIPRQLIAKDPPRPPSRAPARPRRRFGSTPNRRVPGRRPTPARRRYLPILRHGSHVPRKKTGQMNGESFAAIAPES